MSKNAFVRRRAFKSSALLSVAAMATTGLMATAGPAGAVITAGENDAVTGFPAYLVDDQGLALQQCLDACVEPAEEGEPAPAPADPNHAPYFSAEAVAGVFTVSYEVATDAEVEGEAGELINAAGVGARGVTPGARYRIEGPWGAFTVTADDGGRVQADVPNAVKGFLRPVGASAEMLGDGHVFTRVTGSPTGFNQVTVTGPGVNASTNQFALVGQLADDTAMSSVGATSLNLGNRRTANPAPRTIAVSSFGTADSSVTITKAGANPGQFQVVNNCATLAQGSACTISVDYLAKPNRSASAILMIDDVNDLVNAPRQVTLTGTGPDTLSPKIVSASPSRGATGIARAKNVSVKFSERVVGAKQSITLVKSNGRKVAARVSRVGQTDRYVLNPRRALAPRTRYTVKVNGGRLNLRDTVGNVARDAQWRFRTR